MRCLLALLFFAATVFADQSVRLTTLSPEILGPVPCRIHLKDSYAKPIRAPGLPFWNDHFVCMGEVSLKLPLGSYTCEIERGPEYSSISNTFKLEQNEPLAITNYI